MQNITEDEIKEEEINKMRCTLLLLRWCWCRCWCWWWWVLCKWHAIWIYDCIFYLFPWNQSPDGQYLIWAYCSSSNSFLLPKTKCCQTKYISKWIFMRPMRCLHWVCRCRLNLCVWLAVACFENWKYALCEGKIKYTPAPGKDLSKQQ